MNHILKYYPPELISQDSKADQEWEEPPPMKRTEEQCTKQAKLKRQRPVEVHFNHDQDREARELATSRFFFFRPH
jgi:hypothetical protein